MSKKTLWKFLMVSDMSLWIAAYFGYLGKDAEDAADEINAVVGPLILSIVVVVGLLLLGYVFCHALGIVTITSVTPTPVP